MARDKKQLKILAPGAEDPNAAFLEAMGITGLICAVMAAVGFQFLFFPDTNASSPQTHQGRASADKNKPKSESEKLAEKLLEKSESELANTDWTDRQAMAVFEHGPRLAAEKACEASLKDLPKPRAEKLRVALDKRAPHAPRICLVRAWFNKELDAHPELAEEVTEYWDELVRFEEQDMQITLLVNEYRKTRDRPEDPRYYRWLRHCAMRSGVSSWRPCVEAIRQLSPMQGSDILTMIELHLQQAKDPLPQPLEMTHLTETLALIAKNGQPAFWSVEKKSAGEDYSQQMRLASTFYLCRIVNSPNKHDASAAADALGDVAQVTTRGRDELRLERWREACRIAYGGNRPDLEFVDDPILADNNVPQLEVWDGVAGSPPHYALLAAVKRGLCQTEAERPVWYCGVQLWREDAMQPEELILRSFVDTRYLEWTNQ